MKNRVTQAANSFSANFSDRIMERSMNIDPEHSETLGLHGVNYRKDPVTNALAVPIYQTTSYQFDRVEPDSFKSLGDEKNTGLFWVLHFSF